MQNYTFPTVETVRDQAVAETIGSSTSNLTALQDTALIRRLDLINRTFVNEAHIRHPSGGWSWMEDVTNFSTYSGTTLNGAITTASASVILTDAGDFSTAGRLWIKTTRGAVDFVDWTGKSTNTLTGATDIDMSHADAEKVEMLYALPSNYAKAHAVLLDSIELRYERAESLPRSGTFATRGSYLLLPENTGEHDGTLWYEKSPTDLSTGVAATDLAASMDVPEDFSRYAVEMLKAYIFDVRRKEDKAQLCRQYAEQCLQDAISYDSSSTTPTGIRTW